MQLAPSVTPPRASIAALGETISTSLSPTEERAAKLLESTSAPNEAVALADASPVMSIEVFTLQSVGPSGQNAPGAPSEADVTSPPQIEAHNPGPDVPLTGGEIYPSVSSNSAEEALESVDSQPQLAICSPASAETTAHPPTLAFALETPQERPGDTNLVVSDSAMLAEDSGPTVVEATAPDAVDDTRRFEPYVDSSDSGDLASHSLHGRPTSPITEPTEETEPLVPLAVQSVNDACASERLLQLTESPAPPSPTAGEPLFVDKSLLSGGSAANLVDIGATQDAAVVADDRQNATFLVKAASQSVPGSTTHLDATLCQSDDCCDSKEPMSELPDLSMASSGPAPSIVSQEDSTLSGPGDEVELTTPPSLSPDTAGSSCALFTPTDDAVTKDDLPVEPSDTSEDVLPTLPAEASMLCDDLPPSSSPASVLLDPPPESTIPLCLDAAVAVPAVSSPCASASVPELPFPTEAEEHDSLEPTIPADDDHVNPDDMELYASSPCGIDAADATVETNDIPDFDPALDLPPSSPPPSSSPPHIFSSPPRDLFGSPPTSSPPLPQPQEGKEVESALGDLENGTTNEAQNEHGTEDLSLTRATFTTEAVEDAERASKRMKMEPPLPLSEPPQPKRLTQASIAKQRKKLATPFRSPVIKGPLVQGGLHAVYTTGRAFTPPPPPRKALAEDVQDATVKPDPTLANKDRTASVAKQFKSPLSLSAVNEASCSSTLFSATRAAPTIQTLQGKVQTLKQAIRIKKAGNGDEEDELERLVTKWTTVGREVAWAVWSYVKDIDSGTDGAADQRGGWFSDVDSLSGAKAKQKRSFDPNWGYDDDDERSAKRMKLEDGVEQEAEMEEDEEKPAIQHTLGTMLRHMGIDPATLGWDEEEGDFVDA
ncbi:hypothetical protein OH77DRAFT_211638 [Trametes cingulata]|nr:hypothetical protein OH77DRAFT_211638 [Trametes cingulata]